jgi:hypothetical protein
MNWLENRKQRVSLPKRKMSSNNSGKNIFKGFAVPWKTSWTGFALWMTLLDSVPFIINKRDKERNNKALAGWSHPLWVYSKGLAFYCILKGDFSVRWVVWRVAGKDQVSYRVLQNRKSAPISGTTLWKGYYRKFILQTGYW